MNSDCLAEEAGAFDQRIRDRVRHGHIPDLRRVQPCDWFYNNPWRRPEYVDAVFGEYFRFALGHMPKPEARVLEVGSGPGHMALEMARHGFHVTGVELSAECVAVANRLLDENPYDEGFGSVSYITEDFLEWESTQRFDAVCIFLALHHFGDPAKVLDKVVSLLDPGGTIVAVEPARDWFSPLNAAVATLIRLLLSRSGSWYEEMPLPRDPDRLDALVKDCLKEFREARDKHEAVQSPHDNASFAESMLAALRERFDQTACQPGHAIVPRMVGGVRGGSEEETLATAAFLVLFDEYCVRSGLLQPGSFYFAGRARA